MRIGITYDLRSDYAGRGYAEEHLAEFDGIGTIEAIEEALTALGHRPERIGNLQRLVYLLTKRRRWDLVFNIAEGMYGFGRESQIPALLDAYRIPYTFSDPLVNAVTLHKAMAKRIVRDLGIPTTDFFLVERMEDVAAVDLSYPLFAKPVAEGTGKGVTPLSRITRFSELERICKTILDTYRQPVLVETFLPGREFTVGIIGTGARARVLGVLEVILKTKAEKEVYSYHNKENCEELVEYRLVEGPEAEEASAISLNAYRGLGCRDTGRADVRLDRGGKAHFIEVNTLPGLNPAHSDLPILATKKGISFVRLIGMLLESAFERLPASRRAEMSEAI